ncbi:MFS transporter [Autumnicola edwardsiae]|uniref:MFS transporter n=1 Tax=Autumnicola edwardsiae TaxID=3075594 RepID=A0ABU3CW91_9FLAO|nr:MFS transporter [Zunongwangia sp. F297]MDT0650632.1 MFS transporter [Zunongwangia sp. F297]
MTENEPPEQATNPPITQELRKKIGYRWKICALLFFATTLNYIDRHVLSILAPNLQREFGWSEIDYGYIIAAFQAAYGIGVVLVGKLLDHKGIKILYALAVAIWSLAGMGHAFAGSLSGFVLSRFALGLGESANFPAALKTVSEWFPGKERALVAGIFNAGSNVGIIAAALLVPWITLQFGWEWAFIGIGALGFIWIVFWLLTYNKPEQHSKISKEELRYIQAGNKKEESNSVPWGKVLLKKETIIVCLVRFISDPTWWFLLFWLPKFLEEKHEITLTDIALPMIFIYVIADIGSVLGGWLSSHLIKMNKSLDFARKVTMLICAVSVLPIVIVSQTDNLYLSVGLISLAAAAHTGWMANVYAIISDVFPRNAIGSVTGLSTLSAVLGGMLYAIFVGFILEKTGSYFYIFLISGFAYFLAWIILKTGIPEIKSIKFSK